MLTKRQIAEIVIIQKSGGMPGYSKIQPRDVYNVVDTMVSEMVGMEAEKAFKAGIPLDSNWVSTFPHNVIQYDDYNGLCYVKLPASRISLNGDRDIISVSWPQGEDQPFKMIAINSDWAWNLLEAGGYGGTITFRPDDGRLVFTNMPKPYTGKYVTIKMICGLDGYGEDDRLLLPDNFEAKLITLVSQWFENQSLHPAKNTNDTNVNTH